MDVTDVEGGDDDMTDGLTKAVEAMAKESPAQSGPALVCGAPPPGATCLPFGVTGDCDVEIGLRTADAYSKMREIEEVGRIVDPTAKYLEYRRVLVDWMCDAGEWFRLTNSTMHVAVGYLDRILQQVPVAKNRLQLVAMCCIIIAGKYEEAEENVPGVPALIKYANNNYRPQMIHEMEIMVLNRLGWCLTVVTPLHFLGYLLTKGAVFTTDRMGNRPLISKVPKYLRKYVDFFADLCLQDYSFQQYPPSILAAGIVAASRRALNVRPVWCPALSELVRYTEDEVADCFRHIWGYYVESFPVEAAAADAAAETVYDDDGTVVSSFHNGAGPSKDASHTLTPDDVTAEL